MITTAIILIVLMTWQSIFAFISYGTTKNLDKLSIALLSLTVLFSNIAIILRHH